jgi:hypothetical protein
MEAARGMQRHLQQQQQQQRKQRKQLLMQQVFAAKGVMARKLLLLLLRYLNCAMRMYYASDSPAVCSVVLAPVTSTHRDALWSAQRNRRRSSQQPPAASAVASPDPSRSTMTILSCSTLL